MFTRGAEAPTRRHLARPPPAGDRVSRRARHRRHRVPAGPRRSRPAAVAGRRSLWRLPGAAGTVAGEPIGCCRSITRLLVELAHRQGILARNDPRVRLLEGLEQRVEVLHGTVPETDRGPRRARGLPGRSLPRPEDRAVPRSAREPRRRRTLRPRPAARRIQLQRRLRAGARAAVRRGAGDRHLRGRPWPHSRERAAKRPAPTSRRAR